MCVCAAAPACSMAMLVRHHQKECGEIVAATSVWIPIPLLLELLYLEC